MHLGNARSALLGWLQLRRAGGAFLLRIEDLDRARCRPEYVDALYRDLEYLGLTWDESPWFQSQRSEIYEEATARLTAQGRTYPCFCTRTEIARAASAPHVGEEGPRYPGTCCELTPAQRLDRHASRRPALRFRPRDGVVRFVDGLQGPVEQDVHRDVGDFVIRRNDGVASYQLAVVVDDAASGITDVLRGDDLLLSTPRQLLLFEALGLTAPSYAHVPLILGTDGKRLAKREGAFAIADLREAKVPPERIVGLLASWSGLSDGRPSSASELAQSFALEKVRRTPTVASESEIRTALGV